MSATDPAGTVTEALKALYDTPQAEGKGAEGADTRNRHGGVPSRKVIGCLAVAKIRREGVHFSPQS